MGCLLELKWRESPRLIPQPPVRRRAAGVWTRRLLTNRAGTSRCALRALMTAQQQQQAMLR
jgi:hypothetical protein